MTAAGPGEEASEFDALAEDYVERLRRGETPLLDDYVRNHPQYAAKIRRLFPLLSVMEGVSESTVSSRATDVPTHADSDVAPDAPAIPKHIGPHRIVRLLGHGGMGRVYEARVPEDGGEETTVAIKVIHPHLVAKPGYVARFLREAEAGRRVDHPNLVRTLGAGALDLDGVETPYLVLEYVEGQTLRALLREVGEVPERLCRHIGLRVADALASIHAEGVVHRDVKPENILITTGEVVKVMDLGVALLQDEALRISRTGDFVGSLLYAAPEQLDGRTPDARADLYALGRVLFELVCGRLPRRHESPEVDWQRVSATPFFGAILLSLLTPSREDRFPRADQLRDVLRAGERGAWWRKRSREQRLAPSAWQALGFERPTSFHGRDAELSALTSALTRARVDTGQVVLVEGEAGTGKSRLLYEWSQRCERTDPDTRLVVVRHGPGAGTGESASLGAALTAEFGEEQLHTLIESALGADTALTRVLTQQLRALKSGGPAHASAYGVLPTAWLRLLQSIARGGPLVLVFEDLHFGGEEGRGLFRELAAGIRRHPILLLGSTRPMTAEPAAVSLEGLEHASHLRLEGLEQTHCRALVREAWGGSQPPKAEPLLIRQSDGNPFFLLELVRTVRERVDAAGGPTVADAIPTEVPSSVRSLIEAQLARLSDEDRELVQAGACVGFAFDPVLVADVAEVAHVAALKRFGRLERSRGLLTAEGDRYRFRHHLVQEALYQEMHPRLRETYHAAIGNTLLARVRERDIAPDDVEGEEAVRLWHHLFEGGRAEQATPFLSAALQHQGTRGEVSWVRSTCEAALREPGLSDPEDRIVALTHLGRSLRFMALFEESKACLEQAMRLADELDVYPPTASVRGLLAFVFNRLGENELSIAMYQEAIAIAQAAGDVNRAATYQAYLADRWLSDDRVEEAHALCREALSSIAGRDARVAELEINEILGRAATTRGDLREARVHLERAAVLAREDGFRPSEISTVVSLGGLAFRRGDFADAQAHCVKAMDLSLELGLLNRAIGEKTKYALCLLERGRFEEALRVAQEAQEEAVRRDWAGELGMSHAHVAKAQVALGHWREALATLHRAQTAIAEETRGTLNMAARLEWEILLWLGRGAQVEEPMGAAIEEFRRLGNRQMESHLLADRGRLREQAGDLGGAERDLTAAYDMREQGGSLHGLIPLDLGRVLVRRGKIDEGRELLEEARDWAHDGGADGLEARARIHLALLPGGDPLAARLLIEQHEARLTRRERVEANFAVWQATRDPDSSNAARKHLDALVAHAPEEDRASMVQSVELFRRVDSAGRTPNP